MPFFQLKNSEVYLQLFYIASIYFTYMQIVTPSYYSIINQRWHHLIEFNSIPQNMHEHHLDWQVREKINADHGFLLGDLQVIKTKTKVMETHPFSEWVLQSYSNYPQGTVYLLIPPFTQEEMTHIFTLSLPQRKEWIQDALTATPADTFLAFQYCIGVNIKVNAYVPHEFISSCKPDQHSPYCQVFEPNYAYEEQMFRVASTIFYDLTNELTLENS